jgi:hypothetical protein
MTAESAAGWDHVSDITKVRHHALKGARQRPARARQFEEADNMRLSGNDFSDPLQESLQLLYQRQGTPFSPLSDPLNATLKLPTQKENT